jgi:hypothetical protein
MLSTRLSKAAEHRVLIPLLVGALSALLVLSTLFGGSPEEILGALPAILLALALALGRYPGEDAIVRLAMRRRGRRPKAPAAILPSRPGSATYFFDQLTFLAASRSLRGPPALGSSIAH